MMKHKQQKIREKCLLWWLCSFYVYIGFRTIKNCRIASHNKCWFKTNINLGNILIYIFIPVQAPILYYLELWEIKKILFFSFHLFSFLFVRLQRQIKVYHRCTQRRVLSPLLKARENILCNIFLSSISKHQKCIQ